MWSGCTVSVEGTFVTETEGTGDQERNNTSIKGDRETSVSHINIVTKVRRQTIKVVGTVKT